MQEKPYFCPNCRSNRFKFRRLSMFSETFRKDAVTGAILEIGEPQAIAQMEPIIECEVCQFSGNEMRFLKQAEREPRTQTVTV